MKRSLLFSIALIFLGTTPSCSSGGKETAGKNYRLPKPGVIHERISGSVDKDISYSLYLPAGCGENKAVYPVVIAFDPRASGLRPVKMYRELADRYGFILLGSNDSKNGQPGNLTTKIITGLLAEIHDVYPIDTSRIYVAGFSGGSRAATIAAMFHSEVKGVIGCGAGFPVGAQPPSYKFDYFGIAGTADFNLNEMVQLNDILSQLGLRHFITTFPGPHAWPPAGVMEEGFQWITLNAMKDGTMKRNDTVITRIMSGFDSRIAGTKSENQLIAAAEACREAIQFAEGLISTDHFISELRTLEQLPEYKKQTAYRVQILKKEADEQQLLMNAIFTKDETWWKKRVTRMDSQHMKGLNPEDTLMNARLKAFLSLVCYSNANEAMKQHDPDLATNVIAIYEIADQQNPEPNYMRAIILVQQNDTTTAVKQLGIAVGKGFSDKSRMMQQAEFEALKNSPAYFDLLHKMK